MKKCNWIWTLQTYIHTLRCPESVGPTAARPLRGFFISYWGLCRLLCQPSCPHVSGPFVCEVLEVINICFPSSVGEEDPADPLWPLRNPQRVEPVSAFPSLFFWVFFYLWGCLPSANTHVRPEDHTEPGLFNAHLECRAEPRWQVSLRGSVRFYLPYLSSVKWRL